MAHAPTSDNPGIAGKLRPALRVMKNLGLLALTGAATLAMPAATMYGLALRQPLLQHLGLWTAKGEAMLGASALVLAAVAPFVGAAAHHQYDCLKDALRALQGENGQPNQTQPLSFSRN